MYESSKLLELIENEIRHYSGSWEVYNPVTLYKPVSYAMKVGGKRIRPLLVLLGYQLYDNQVEKAMKAALAIEIFHNFTLLHDDIMDKAEMRRNHPSVYVRFNENTAILSGDVMSFLAYGLLSELKSERAMDIISLFTLTAKEICEGQQLDMDFEKRLDVTSSEYLEMIRLKTAVLLGCSLKTGGLLAGCDEKNGQVLYDAGVNLGMAFQLMDDLLDTFGNERKFGKKIGGDIVSNKKTFLLVESLQQAPEPVKKELISLLSKEFFNKDEKIPAVKNIYENLGIRVVTENKINDFTLKGMGLLESLPVDTERLVPLVSLVKSLTDRNH